MALAAGGCGGGSSGSSGRSGAAAVAMKELAFAPRTTVVKVGQKVTWTNEDGVDHNVTATSGARFRSQAFGSGRTYTYTPRRPARIAYVCTLHPQMTATVVVKAK